MLTGTLFLDKCWVCGRLFDHSTKEEKHHIVPKAYGGVNGPQVSLCDSHHQALHNIGIRMYAKKPFNDLLTPYKDQNQKLIWLGSVACNARIATERDPNKQRVLVLNPSGDTFNKLKKLKPIFHQASRERIIEIAVAQLYDRHFK